MNRCLIALRAPFPDLSDFQGSLRSLQLIMRSGLKLSLQKPRVWPLVIYLYQQILDGDAEDPPGEKLAVSAYGVVHMLTLVKAGFGLMVRWPGRGMWTTQASRSLRSVRPGCHYLGQQGHHINSNSWLPGGILGLVVGANRKAARHQHNGVSGRTKSPHQTPEGDRNVQGIQPCSAATKARRTPERSLLQSTSAPH